MILLRKNRCSRSSPTKHLSHCLDLNKSTDDIVVNGEVSVESPEAELRNSYRDGSSTLKIVLRSNDTAGSNHLLEGCQLMILDQKPDTRRLKLRYGV